MGYKLLGNTEIWRTLPIDLETLVRSCILTETEYYVLLSSTFLLSHATLPKTFLPLSPTIIFSMTFSGFRCLI